MTRVFTFGCSYTSYIWPTWADIIIKEYESKGVQGYNYGCAGMGNMGILHTMVRADYEHNFTDQDVIAVVWSSWNREDRYVNNTWQAHGNVLNNKFYDNDFIKKYWSLEDDLIKNITAITCARKCFKPSFEGSIRHNETLKSYSNDPVLDCFTNVKTVNNLDHLKKARIAEYNAAEHIWHNMDGHPLISDHLSYATNVVCPALGTSLSESTINWIAQKDKEMQKLVLDISQGDKVTERHILQNLLENGPTPAEQLWDSEQLVNYLSKFSNL
jgi:hypothetical protein